ncbi:MAG: GntR family transcriptional regulator [Pseudomonadota bacterium]|nr:GntR family transcriptional regulator [Pseudomonadota bacterium]
MTTLRQRQIASSYEDARVPRYVQVASALRRRIQEGQWTVGDKIATLEKLEGEYGVARVTVRQAIELLQREGLLKSFQGKGTYVTRTPENLRWLHLAVGLDELVESISRNVPHFISGERAQELQLDPSEGKRAPEYEFRRSVQMSGNERYAFASVHIAKHVFERNRSAFDKRVALAVIAEMKGADIWRAHQTLQISAADIETSMHLRIPLNAPTAEARCIVTDKEGVAIYVGDIIYRGDRVKLDIELLNKNRQ